MPRLRRALGIDDGPSTLPSEPRKSRHHYASLVAVWFAGLTVDDIRIGVVQVDGLDATDVILRLTSRRRVDVIFLSGASFAGFNIADSGRLHRILHVPVIVISREKPNNASVKRALKNHFADWKTRWDLVRRLGRIHSYAPKSAEAPLYFEAIGISATDAKKIIRAYCITSRVPEPIRVAGIVAKGLALTGNELRAR